MEEVVVTRKYQITIPKDIRRKLEIEIGDRLTIRYEGGLIIIEASKKVADPSEFLWSLSDEPRDVDVLKLVEESWEEHRA